MAKNKLVEEIEVVEEVVVVDEVVEVDEVALNTPAPEVEYPGHNTRAFRQ